MNTVKLNRTRTISVPPFSRVKMKLNIVFPSGVLNNGRVRDARLDHGQGFHGAFVEASVAAALDFCRKASQEHLRGLSVNQLHGIVHPVYYTILKTRDKPEHEEW